LRDDEWGPNNDFKECFMKEGQDPCQPHSTKGSIINLFIYLLGGETHTQGSHYFGMKSNCLYIFLP